MADINDVVQVTVNVADTRISRAGFGTPLIFDLIADSVFAERVRVYTDLAGVAVDFPSTTKVYKCAAAIFAQERTPERVKVGRHDSGDADLDAALAAIELEDPDWYCLLSPKKVHADIDAIAAWILANKRAIFLTSSEDADVITNATDDVASGLQDAANNRVAYKWHHQAGVDATGVDATVASGIATITETGHGLLVGDPVTISGAAKTQINGNKTVLAITDDDNFTVDATGAADGADGNNGSIDYFARYTFPEAAWAGLQLPTTPGSTTWKFKQLAGIIPTPKSILNSTEEANALGKNANLYVPIANVGNTIDGVMASGRFLDVQRGIDWLHARLGEEIMSRLVNSEKVPYTDAGFEIFRGDIALVLSQGVVNGLLGPLLDSDSGEFFRITIPKVADQTVQDRQDRNVAGILAQAQLAGAAHSLAITVNASV